MKCMCKLLCALYIGFILLPSIYVVSAETSLEQESSLINSYEEDITGDGFREYLKLQGNALSTQSIFYPDVWVDITNPFSQHWKISLQAGYDPDIQLIDLTHDQIVDVFYMVAKDIDKQQYDYQLYSLTNGTVERIQLPKHQFLQIKLINDFKIQIQMNPHEKPIIHTIEETEQYIAEKIYHEDGRLLESDRKIQLPAIYFMEPILISEANGYGLKTHQKISGLFNEELGEVQTLWYFNHDDWIGLKTDWIKK